jgi:DeoR/GlpR family transcriptional regulator of sugar metabolism
MIAQYIQLGDKGWNVLVYYGVHKEDFIEVEDALKQLGCSHSDIRKSLKVLTKKNKVK